MQGSRRRFIQRNALLAEENLTEPIAHRMRLRQPLHFRAARPRKIDPDSFHNPARPRAHDRDRVREKNRFCDGMRDEKRRRRSLCPDF
jgi:hypothetical protein